MEKALRELRQEVQDTEACTSCGTCVYLCPNILSIEDRIAAVADCRIRDGRCYSCCPRTPPIPGMEGMLFGDMGFGGLIGPCKEIFIARSPLARGCGIFQYGGVVSALLLQALRSGRADKAVVTAMKGNYPVPFAADSEQDLLSAAGSKFALSPTNREVNRLKSSDPCRLAVVSLPCQATGLRKRESLPEPEGAKEGGVVLIIGLFCTWALGQRGWRSILNKYVADRSVIKMDIPPPPANKLILETVGKRIEIPLDEVNPHVRPGCRVCLDMTAENADVSVGTVEGMEGCNTVVIRTENGAEVVREALECGLLEREALDPERLSHLKAASLNKKRRAIAEAERRSEPLPFYERIKGLKGSLQEGGHPDE